MLPNDSLDAIRERVRRSEALKTYPVDADTIVTLEDRRALLRLIDVQQKALDKAVEFTHLYEDRLIDSLSENTLQYFRRVLAGD